MIDGIIGRKLGMTQLFREDGIAEAVTVIEASPCAVVQVKTAGKEGYNAVQLGYGKAKKLSSRLKGILKGPVNLAAFVNSEWMKSKVLTSATKSM